MFHKRKLWIGLALSVIWIILSILAGAFSIGFWMVIAQLLAGLLATFGGRRTDAGMQAYAQVLGLRRYLRRVSREDLQRISQSNPEYFYTMIPYALALGVDKQFARRFGKMLLPECPYMDLHTDVQLTASAWRERLRHLVAQMNQRRSNMWRERITGLMGRTKR